LHFPAQLLDPDTGWHMWLEGAGGFLEV
jgi:hypothetical protein